MADAKDEVISGPDPVRALHRMCFCDLTRLLDTPMSRLGLIASAEAEGDPVIGEAVSRRHRENGPLWKDFFTEFLRSRGLRLRSGVTLDECVDLLIAVTDGLAMRALADPDSRIIDRARRRCLLSTATFALIAGLPGARRCQRRPVAGTCGPRPGVRAARGFRPEAGLRWTSSPGCTGC